MRRSVVIAIVAACVACSGDDEATPIDAALDAAVDAVIDTPADAATCGPAPGGCDLVVANAMACPSLAEICRGVCNAAHDCCYCATDVQTGQPYWGDVISDCPPCVDAGADAP